MTAPTQIMDGSIAIAGYVSIAVTHKLVMNSTKLI
jgi:hypothetical protein